MAGISPRLPLKTGSDNGYVNITTLKESIKQNFKMLLLTSPGEYVFNRRFGVGLRRYLFENAMNSNFETDISSKIHQQVNEFMPFLSINDIKIIKTPENNAAKVSILYSVPSISLRDNLTFDQTF